MSAYVVDRDTIDLLVAAALTLPELGGRHGEPEFTWWVQSEQRRHRINRPGLHPDDDPSARYTPDSLGRLLWTENVSSVSYRYPGERPNQLVGPADTRWLAEYTARTADLVGAIRAGRIRLADIASTVAGYHYQSCEHPEWHDSVAAAFCRGLEVQLLRIYAHGEEQQTGHAVGWGFTRAQLEESGR
jgi:hypothetical protein